MKPIVELIAKFFRLKWRYLLSGSIVYVGPGSHFSCAKNVKIIRSKIHLQRGSSFEIGENSVVEDTVFSVNKGDVKIGISSRFFKGTMPVKQHIVINEGNALFGSNDRVCLKKMWIRFGGTVRLGDYVFVNDFSEIRCDESIKVGDFTMISYNVKIWDTNTHEIESLEQRRARWLEKGMLVDVQEKPSTKPVEIGTDNWIGDSVVILKGTVTGIGCICGTGTILAGKVVPDKMTVTNKIELKMKENYV